MDLTSSSSKWIWAQKGGSLQSNDKNVDIDQHDNFGIFGLDMSKAIGGSSVNPFVTASNVGSSSSGNVSPSSASNAVGTTPTSSSGSSDNSGSADGSSASGDSTSDGSSDDSTMSDSYENMLNNMVTAHGVIMGLAFV